MAKKKDRLECRIRYVEDWNGRGEHFVFENKWTNEDAWGLDTAFPLFDAEWGKGELIHYTALTKIRDLMDMGIDVYFSHANE